MADPVNSTYATALNATTRTGVSSIQSVANATIKITHPSLNGGAVTTFAGIRLEGAFVDAEQSVDNSKRVPLIDGSTISLVNKATFGVLTLNLSRIGTAFDTTAQDVVLGSLAIQKGGSSIGASIQVLYYINGKNETWSFTGCTLMKCPPLKLAGDDVPVYSITWSYDDYNVSVSA